jgi:hypothetical protein
MDYIINPVMMGGLVKELVDDQVKVHLHGRLGVITVPKKLIRTNGKVESEKLEPGHEMEFYFSYLQVVESGYDYDSAAMKSDTELIPSLLGGRIIEVNDTAAKVEIMENMGTIAVPKRWLFTDVPLKTGQEVEFYMSPMRVIGKRDIPQESI